MRSDDIKGYLQRIIASFDAGETPRRPRTPAWVRTMAGPAALGVALGLGGGCANDPEEIDRGEVRQGKADGFIDDWCEELGAERGCDICQEAGWYSDDYCDDFCNFPDPDCGGLGDIVALYMAPPPDPWPCFDDDACPPGFECQTIENTNSNCPPGALCILPPIQGECVVSDRTECNGHADCATGFYCDDHNIGQCPPGAFCILPPSDGECVANPNCSTDDDCPSDMECVDHDADSCPPGAFCIMPPTPGVCRVSCNFDNECPVDEVCVDNPRPEVPEGMYPILPPTTGSCQIPRGCGDGTQALCEILPADCPDGLVREVVNNCFGECVDPETCEAPEANCDDGTTLDPLCDMAPVCDDGLIRATQNACFVCVDPETCEPPESGD